MNASLVKGLIIGGVFATAGGAVAGYNMIERQPAFADVLEVVPATELVSVPREVCEDVEVVHQSEPRDQKRLMGTVTGAILGGVLGNQVGGGNGKKVATVAGAAAGAYAGNKMQQRAQNNDTYTTTETRCAVETSTVENVVGYDVTYAIAGVQAQIRLDHEPGEQIPLVDGELMIN